jgi:hypothetical protein
MGSYSPHELAFDASYNRKLTDHFALGIAGRFIYSNLTGVLPRRVMMPYQPANRRQLM